MKIPDNIRGILILKQILEELLDEAVTRGLIEDSVAYQGFV